MFHFILFALMAIGLGLGMIVFLEVGRLIGKRTGVEETPAANVLEGSVFALFGLLLAFAFSGAIMRFDMRRQLMVEEANQIGTAYLRLDLLPPEGQTELRKLFREYVEGRIEVYRKLPDVAAAELELERVKGMQQGIWTAAIAETGKIPNPTATMLLLPSLNQMFDILTTQTMATRTHPPTIIFFILFALALICSMLAGFGLARSNNRHYLRIYSYVLAISFAIYIIIDLEFPRLGFIRIEDFDQVLVDLLAGMQ